MTSIILCNTGTSSDYILSSDGTAEYNATGGYSYRNNNHEDADILI